MDKHLKFLIKNKDSLVSSFSKLPMDLTEQKYTTANLHEKKNNFPNVLASDESRVKLKRSSGDYINANYMLDDKYIATQQPNEHTIVDFWHMIYQTKSKTIINVNGENNYLPLNDNETYDDISVKVVNISRKENLEIRKLQIYKTSLNELPLYIYHITFLKWKDFDIPKEEAFMRLLILTNILETRECNDKPIVERRNAPIVVHCRAGIGRTGTFILIHYLHKQICLGNYLDPIETLKQMRKSRYGMIQNKRQFNFVLHVIINTSRNRIRLEPIKVKNPLSSSCGKMYNRAKTKKSSLSFSSEIIIS